jgi:hypothetical protein
MARFELENNYCPKLAHAIATKAVCERRTMAVMAPVWTECQGCDPEATLTKPDGQKNLTTYSDPPPQWFNMDRYIQALGEDVCKRFRGSGIGLLETNPDK